MTSLHTGLLAPRTDTHSRILDERPDLAGAEFAALEQAAELITTATP